MSRRPVLPVLTILLLIASAVPALAARRPAHQRHIARVTVQAEGHGSLIAVTYTGSRHHVRFVHSAAPIDRVAVTDVDSDGEQEILAAAHEGDLLIWRNLGHGRFTLATPPRDPRLVPDRGPRFVRVKHADDGSQWGDERYDAAMPRAPAATALGPIAAILTPAPVPPQIVAIRSSSGRAPPSLA
jgi:hypothetical protein